MERRRLFLSHSAVDVQLAAFLQTTAASSIPNVEVFRTTRVGEIPAGRAWFDKIETELRAADCFLVLLSHASMARPWVCFETGAAWYSKRPMVPALAPGVRPDEIPEPMRLLQLLSLGDTEQASQVFRELGGRLAEPEQFVRQAAELAHHGKKEAIRERFDGLDHEGTYYAYDGPLQELPTGDAVPMPTGLILAFREAGFEPVMTIPSRPQSTFAAGYKWVWCIDQWGQKRPMLDRDQNQLCVKRAQKPGA